jgi:metal-dependent HD superfamily phosphatase/phosphodiesterase
MITFEQIKNNEDVKTYITKADASLKALGYTEHSFAHVGKVASDAAYILGALGYDERTVELAKIAGHLHDIGNLVNRVDHSQSGAVMAFRLLDNIGMPADEIATVVTAIGNHDEGTGVPVNAVAAALIIADKCDVRRTRVRNCNPESFDIHDRVNYSVEVSTLNIDPEKKEITLELTIDSEISAVMDYFQIFLGRMQMAKSAAKSLELNFSLVINKQKLL